MRYYIAYKFADNDKDLLKKNLETISDIIEKTDASTFIFCRDMQRRWTIEMTINEIIHQAFDEVKKSDAIIALIESEEKSEGMLLEIGYAKAVGKKLIVVIKKWVNLRFVRALADEVIEFEKVEDIKITL